MDQGRSSSRPVSGCWPYTDATGRVNKNVARINRDRAAQQNQQRVVGAISPHADSSSPLVVVENKQFSTMTESENELNRNPAVSTTSTASGKGKMKTHVGPWQLGRTLGKGATGSVRLARHRVTGQTAAVKIVSKKSAAMVQSESIAAMDHNRRLPGSPGARPVPCGIEREVVIMKLIEHPNIISLYDVWENGGELWVNGAGSFHLRILC
jgi:serine/threonine-protein kinase HSL1, negative regulator of Swe1 kinase